MISHSTVRTLTGHLTSSFRLANPGHFCPSLVYTRHLSNVAMTSNKFSLASKYQGLETNVWYYLLPTITTHNLLSLSFPPFKGSIY